MKFKAKYYEQKLSDVSKSDTLSDDDVKILRKYGPVKSVYDCCKYVTFWFETLVNKCSFQFLKHTILDQKLALKKKNHVCKLFKPQSGWTKRKSGLNSKVCINEKWKSWPQSNKG